MRMLLACISLCLSMALTGQENIPGINSALLNAIVDPDSRSVQVKVYYDLNVSVGEIELKALNFPMAPIGPVRAFINGEKREISFEQNGKITSASLEFGYSGNVGLQLNYEIPLGASDPFTLIIPVIYPDIKATEARQDFFNAAVQVKGYQIHEAFPTASWSMETKGDWDMHSLKLQAVPSMLKLKLGIESRPLLSTLNLVDMLVLLILITLLAIGWKKIRMV